MNTSISHEIKNPDSERTLTETLRPNISVKLKDVPESKSFLGWLGKGRIISLDEENM